MNLTTVHIYWNVFRCIRRTDPEQYRTQHAQLHSFCKQRIVGSYKQVSATQLPKLISNQVCNQLTLIQGDH